MTGNIVAERQGAGFREIEAKRDQTQVGWELTYPIETGFHRSILDENLVVRDPWTNAFIVAHDAPIDILCNMVNGGDVLAAAGHYGLGVPFLGNYLFGRAMRDLYVVEAGGKEEKKGAGASADVDVGEWARDVEKALKGLGNRLDRYHTDLDLSVQAHGQSDFMFGYHIRKNDPQMADELVDVLGESLNRGTLRGIRVAGYDTKHPSVRAGPSVGYATWRMLDNGDRENSGGVN